MALLFLMLLSFIFTAESFSAPSARVFNRQASTTTSAAPANPTICGDIIDDVNQGFFFFYAIDAYNCLLSVPFVDDVALRFIDYYNTTMQFQSTLAYLKNPPRQYQQPAVDFQQRLEKIKQDVLAGNYKSQYSFEADIQQLVYAVHDAHVDLYAGILASFSFGGPFSLVTASVDGVQTPKIYVEDDVRGRQDYGWEISAIATINGKNVVDFLTDFATQNSVGMLERHGDWNQMMGSPVLDILDDDDLFFSGGTFYPGDSLIFSFENGSTWYDNWTAIYNNAQFTGPLTTGGDYYNYFVLGLLPASYDEVDIPPAFAGSPNNTDVNAAAPLNNWFNVTSGSFPDNPDVVQTNLATGVTGGVVTGYFLEDISTGVLSIPSFDERGFDIEGFTDAVNQFITVAQNKSLTKVVIDLQRNSGGMIELAFVTFRQFFPGIDPFAGSRRRSHPLADVIGNSKTNFWNSLSLSSSDSNSSYNKETLAGDEWVITDRLRADTGRNFTSWPEYFGPLTEDGDFFSLVERYDLADQIFDESAFDDWVPVEYTTGNIPAGPGPWKAEDIVILTDGICSSTCTLFLEMMTHQAGVRTIVLGGRPTDAGPMQAASGSRGARAYTSDLLDVDLNDTAIFNSSAVSQGLLPPVDATTGVRDPGMFITFAGFTLRDQVRTSAGGPPLQFEYIPADCRLYFTLNNALNMSRLWRDVAAAAWQDWPARCVPGSTASSSANGTTTPPPPPPPPPPSNLSIRALSTADVYPGNYIPLPDDVGGLEDGKRLARGVEIVQCSQSCSDPRLTCKLLSVPCSDGRGGQQLHQLHACVPSCLSNSKTQCTSNNVASLVCDTSAAHVIPTTKNAIATGPRSRTGGQVKAGFCVPTLGTTSLGCPARNFNGSST